MCVQYLDYKKRETEESHLWEPGEQELGEKEARMSFAYWGDHQREGGKKGGRGHGGGECSNSFWSPAPELGCSKKGGDSRGKSILFSLLPPKKGFCALYSKLTGGGRNRQSSRSPKRKKMKGLRQEKKGKTTFRMVVVLE